MRALARRAPSLMTVCLATLALWAFGAHGEAQAGTSVIASGRGATGITAHGGHVVWSARAPGARRWRLMHWHAGRVRTLSAAGTRGVPFDADVGPDTGGRPVVVFSRCQRDPRSAAAWLQARGCRLFELPLTGSGTARELTTPLPPGVSATTPSRWRGRLAFARHPDREPTSEVVLLTDATQVLQPLPDRFVSCEVDCDQKLIELNVESLDLGAQGVAFLRSQSGADTVGIGSEGQLIAAPVDGAAPQLLSLGFVDGACGYVAPFSPTARGRGAFWVAAGSPCDSTETDFAEAGVVARRRRSAEAPGRRLILGASQDGTTTYWIGLRGVETSLPNPTACRSRVARCQILRTTRLPLRTLRRGEPLGPEPEEG